MPDHELIVNATAIGRRVDGIAVYGVHLVTALWHRHTGPLTVYLNEEARDVFPPGAIPHGAPVRWVSAKLSPSYGSPGNLRRCLFANALAVRHAGAMVFGLSQLEAPIVGGGAVMVHDMIPWLFRESHPRQSHFYRVYLRPALTRAVAIVTPSQRTKDDLCRHYGIAAGRIHVIPHGCPVPLSTASGTSARAGDPYVLWIGRDEPTKNLAAVVQAFRVASEQVALRLVLAGDGPPIPLTTSGLNGADGVTVVGAVSEREKLALLDNAAALVCPSLYEGFGFAPLEAMARGCPVVAAPSGALPEVCGDAAIYADPSQPAAMAAALVRIVKDAGFARGLAERGRARAAAMTWDASVREHLAVFDRAARVRWARAQAPCEPRAEADVLE